MPIKLPSTGVAPGLAVASGFTSAAKLLTIPALTAKPWGKFVCRNTGNSGTWYGCYEGRTPTTSSYDFILGAHEAHQQDNPPTGDVNILASASGIGDLSYSANWAV